MTTDLRPLFDEDRPDGASSNIVSNVGVAASPFTGGAQVVELPGARWQLTYNFATLDPHDARTHRAIKAICRGGAEVVHINDFNYLPRRNAEPGAPVVRAPLGEGGGNVLLTEGWTPSTAVLDIGDQLSYLGPDGFYRMHVVILPAISDAAGLADVTVYPPIRNAPAVGTAIDSVNPTVSCHLTGGGEITTEGWVVGAQYEFTEWLGGIL